MRTQVLTIRSKILVTITTVATLATLLDYVRSREPWFEEPVEYWHNRWIVIGVLVIVAVASIVIDLRRSRMSY